MSVLEAMPIYERNEPSAPPLLQKPPPKLYSMGVLLHRACHLFALLVFIFIARNAITVVPPGTVAIFTSMGTVSTISEGIYLTNPLGRRDFASTRTQLLEHVFRVPTKEGLLVELKILT